TDPARRRGLVVERRVWDLNPRWPCDHNGFRDRPIRPLWQPSVDHRSGALVTDRKSLRAVRTRSATPDGGGAVRSHLAVEVERERTGRQARIRVELVGGNDPADLELEAVGILGVEALRGPV